MATFDHLSHVEIIAEPTFIDTAACQCALRPIAEQGVIDLENTQAWRCIADHTQDIYKGLSGTWYFSVPKESHAVEGGRERVLGFPRPDIKTGYNARLVDDKRLRVRSIHPDLPTPLDDQCTGEARDQEENMTGESRGSLLTQRDARAPTNTSPGSSDPNSTQDKSSLEETSTPDAGSPAFSNETTSSGDGTSTSRDDTLTSTDDVSTHIEESPPRSQMPTKESPKLRATSGGKSLTENARTSTCMNGDGAVGVPIQDASSWQTVGCLPGFMCELAFLL